MTDVILEQPTDIKVRTLELSDLEDVVRIDAANFGRPRRDYYRLKLEQAVHDTSVRMSLAAEIDGALVGFLMGSVFYGDYGVPEPMATLDAISVHSDFARRGVAASLWHQFSCNLKGMRIDRVQTQVDWTDWDLMTFFRKVGFRPSTRICVERHLDLEGDD